MLRQVRMTPSDQLSMTTNNNTADVIIDRYPLVDRSGNLRHDMGLHSLMGTVQLQLVLPRDVVCSQCVLQWFWYGGNSGDRLAQETFVNCADVAITLPDGSLPAGLTLPEISPQAYKPIRAMTHRLQMGNPVRITDLL